MRVKLEAGARMVVLAQGRGIKLLMSEERPACREGRRTCDQTLCAGEAVARVEILPVEGDAMKFFTCEEHLSKVKEAHAERPKHWPEVGLMVERLKSAG